MPNNLNSTILAACWLSGSTDFQQRVPDPSQHNMAEVIAAFEQPNSSNMFQEVTGLFTTIGISSIESRRFEDPLSFLEGRVMPFGTHVVHTAHHWEKARAYSSDAQALLKRRKDKFIQSFSGLNRMDRYDTSVSRTEYMQSLQPGFDGNNDGYGLDALLGAKFDAIYSPEAYDSMRYTLQIVAETEEKWGGLYKQQVPEVINKDTGEEFMATIAGLIYRWRFPSTVWNKLGYEGAFCRPDDIVILAEPETLASLDFRTLLDVFQIDLSDPSMGAAELRRRFVPVPDFPIPNVKAIVADRRFFDIHRSFYSLENFYNPQQVVMNYYLQSQGVWAANPMYNIALFGDFSTTEIPTCTVVPSSIELTPVVDTVPAGGTVQIRSKITANISTTPTGIEYGEITPEPDSVTYAIEASAGKINRNTFIDRFGVLHVQKTGLNVGTVLTITGTSTYINPSGATEELTNSCAVTIGEPPICDGDNTENDQLGYTDIRDANLKDEALDLGNPEPVNP